MSDPNEKFVYVGKMDRIVEKLEELMLDALLVALRKFQERNEPFRRLAQASSESKTDSSDLPINRSGSSNLEKS